jgi:hypothetical protein
MEKGLEASTFELRIERGKLVHSSRLCLDFDFVGCFKRESLTLHTQLKAVRTLLEELDPFWYQVP